MNHKRQLFYLLELYFDVYEAQYYHPAYVDRARRDFKRYVIKSGELDKIVLGYIEKQMEILRNVPQRT